MAAEPNGYNLRCSALVFRNDHVLLVRRDRQADWVLPGGTPNRGETVASCTHREVAEETGLHVTVDRVAFVLEAHSEKERVHLLDLVFTATEIDPGRPPKDVEAGLSPVFFPVADLADLRLRPPIAGFVRSLYTRGSRGEGAYLGNVWRPSETPGPNEIRTFDEWES